MLDSLRGTASLNAPRVVAAGYTAEKIQADARRSTGGGWSSTRGRRRTATAATANGTGRVAAGETRPLAFDLRGRARGLDLRRLPRDLKVPPVESTITADYHVAGTLPSAAGAPAAGAAAPAARPMDIKGDARSPNPRLPGRRIAGGSTVAFTLRGERRQL